MTHRSCASTGYMVPVDRERTMGTRAATLVETDCGSCKVGTLSLNVDEAVENEMQLKVDIYKGDFNLSEET